jgi:guanylate kinase
VNSSKKRPGLFFTLVAPAGAGKNRLMKRVLERTPLHQLATATTRPMRPGEQEGREHLYRSVEEFQRMIEAGELLEHQTIHGHLYGIPRAEVEAALDSGKAIIADIEVKGAAEARAAYPENVVSIFIQTPSISSLIERMDERGESRAEIGKRLLRVPMELAYAPQCDYAILNDSFEHAANQLYEIVTAELRGERAPCPDTLRVYHFAYYAQTVPLYHHEVLRRQTAPSYPTTPFNPEHELPHQAALRALNEELGMSGLIGGDKRDGDYLPPIALDYAQDSSGFEDITYIYFCELDKRIEAPNGWAWHSVENLPEAHLRTELLEHRSEA